MLNIFVLEDDFVHQARLEQAIQDCVRKGNVDYKSLEIFGKPKQLLEAIQETGNHQFFFLDIDIHGEKKKGIEIARDIRSKDPNASIVFVTTRSEFMPITYKYRVSALDFIDKGLPDEEFQVAIRDVLTYAYENMDSEVADDAFVFRTEQSNFQVPFSDILYFETAPTAHKLILTTKKGHMEFYGKLSEIVKSDNRLYQTHRSYVVNPRNVVSVDRTKFTIYFENDETCFVSRLKLKGLVERMEK
ncbi:response regulator transcription factor [Streptococcus thoraltensis]|uniref:response regulator transcription factor n=1 Tax=Streptococcus thoraltensis TaxID=55085 RepID=UPI001F567E18|nr:response regulator transcription factor [Streptococcus thoraltensis]